jgi:hypothetical protein
MEIFPQEEEWLGVVLESEEVAVSDILQPHRQDFYRDTNDLRIELLVE